MCLIFVFVNIKDIHKCSVQKKNIKCLGLLSKYFYINTFSGSLASMANVPNQAKCIRLKNQPCMARSTRFNLNPDKCNQALLYYPFMVNLY